MSRRKRKRKKASEKGQSPGQLPQKRLQKDPVVEYIDREVVLAMLKAAVDMHDTQERGRTNRTVAYIVGAVAVVFTGGGIWLTALGAGAANSTMKIFGQELSTTSVGLGCVFIGGVVLVMVLRRVLR